MARLTFTAQTQGALPTGNLIVAVQKALRQTMTEAKNDAAEKIESRYVSPQLGTKKLKVSVRGLTGILKSSGRRNPLKKFEINPRKRLKKPPANGVFARVLKSGGGFLRHAFIAKGNVFERTGRARLPIRSFSSVSAPGMLKASPVISSVIKQIEKNFSRHLQSQIAQIF